jgi:hypothetical protein
LIASQGHSKFPKQCGDKSLEFHTTDTWVKLEPGWTALSGILGARRLLRAERASTRPPVNVSARLCGIAAGGQILVSDVTASKLDSRFHLEPLPDAALKGREKPMPIFAVRRA